MLETVLEAVVSLICVGVIVPDLRILDTMYHSCVLSVDGSVGIIRVTWSSLMIEIKLLQKQIAVLHERFNALRGCL